MVMGRIPHRETELVSFEFLSPLGLGPRSFWAQCVRGVPNPMGLLSGDTRLSGPKNRCAQSLSEDTTAAYHGSYAPSLEFFCNLLPYGSGSPSVSPMDGSHGVTPCDFAVYSPRPLAFRPQVGAANRGRKSGTTTKEIS